MQDMSPRICFRGTKYVIFREHVSYLHHIPGIIYCDAGSGCLIKLHAIASIVCRFLSRISYFSSYVFLRRRRSFTSGKLYACPETFVCFLHISDLAYVSRARCIGLFLLLFVLTPHDSNVAVYALVC